MWGLKYMRTILRHKIHFSHIFLRFYVRYWWLSQWTDYRPIKFFQWLLPYKFWFLFFFFYEYLLCSSSNWFKARSMFLAIREWIKWVLLTEDRDLIFKIWKRRIACHYRSNVNSKSKLCHMFIRWFVLVSNSFVNGASVPWFNCWKCDCISVLFW